MLLRTKIAAATVAVGLMTGAAYAQQTSQGLVTVTVGDVQALNDIGIAQGNTVQVPIGIAAQVCPSIDVNALTDEQRGGNEPIDCTVTQESASNAFVNFVQNQQTSQNQGQGNQGQGNQGQQNAQTSEGLVTVTVGDVQALNDIGVANGNSVQIPVGIAAQVCPDLDVNALTDEQTGGNEPIDCTVDQGSASESFIRYVQNQMTSQGNRG